MRFDNRTARLEVEEKAKGSSGVLETMIGQLITLRVDVYQLRSTDISILWGNVPLLDVPSYMPPTMPNIEPFSSVKPSRIAEVVAIFVEDVVNDDEWDDDDLLEETDDD
uniref:Polyprotein protein n=1 Tax=Solanum tuberosum TaxID=4113 RepID=M1DQ29_SOLTU